MNRRVEGHEVIILEPLTWFFLGCLLHLWVLLLLLRMFGNQDLGLSGANDGSECFFLVYELFHIKAQHTPNSIQTNKSPSECVKEKPG
jgi:hypothetical protein